MEVIFETKQASVSMLQRRLKLGYSRAARLVDQMEELGVVGPFEGSKPRQIMITREQWQEMQLIRGTAPLEAPPEEVPVQEDDMVFQEMDTRTWTTRTSDSKRRRKLPAAAGNFYKGARPLPRREEWICASVFPRHVPGQCGRFPAWAWPM